MTSAAMIPALLAAGWFVPTAMAAETGVRVDERAVLRYYVEDQDLPGFEDLDIYNYWEQVNRTNLLVTRSRWALGLQFDEVALLGNKYILDGELYHERQLVDPAMEWPWTELYLNVEKVFVRYQSPAVEVVLGDGYASFGRGLSLNLVRNTDIDLDTSLQGVKTTLTSGRWTVMGVTGLANPQQVQQDNRNIGIHPDLRHVVSGVRAEVSGLGPVTLGAHGVAYQFARDPDARVVDAFSRYGEPLDAAVGGASLEAYGVGGLDLVLEGDAFFYGSEEFFEGEEPQMGHGLYGSVSAYPGSFTLLVEAKQYKDTERINKFAAADSYEVVVPPTLEYERVITEDSAAAVNSNDVTGARARIQYIAIPGVLLPYVSIAVFRDRELGGLHFNATPETIAHGMGGVQWTRDRSHLLLNAGYRADVRDDDTGSDRLAHGDVSIQVPLGRVGDLEVASAVKRFWWGENPQQQADFTEAEDALSLHTGERWTFTVFQDWSDNPLIGGSGNLADRLYGAGEVQFKVTSSAAISAFYGAYKAGIRCSGGQCRNLPGFDGFRVAANGSF